MTIQYLDTCLPDYFNGFHKPVIGVPVSNTTTQDELIELIVDEYNQIYEYLEPYWPEEESQLRASCENLFVKREGGAIVFPDLETISEEEQDYLDSVYSYFCWEVEQ